MNPPRNANASGEGGVSANSKHYRGPDSSTRAGRPLRPRLAPTSRRYEVVIVAGERRGSWGRYQTAEAAAEMASRLRRLGMLAEVVEPTHAAERGETEGGDHAAQ